MVISSFVTHLLMQALHLLFAGEEWNSTRYVDTITLLENPALLSDCRVSFYSFQMKRYLLIYEILCTFMFNGYRQCRLSDGPRVVLSSPTVDLWHL